MDWRRRYAGELYQRYDDGSDDALQRHTSILPQGDAFQASTTATIPAQNVSLAAIYSAIGAATGTGLRGQYYNDGGSAVYPLATPFTSSPVLTGSDGMVDFDWAETHQVPE